MLNDFKRLVLLSISFLFTIFSFAQGLGNSPYSSIGIGDMMNYRGSIRNMGMGYAGSTLGSKEYINFLNPAGLPNFKYKYVDSLVKFDVGFSVQYKTFTTGNSNSVSLGANINHIAFSFPVSRIFTTGLMLTPLSIVQNNYSFTSTIANDPNNYTSVNKFVGNGGIYQFQWMNGMSVSKNLSLGLTTSYNFGNTTQEASTQLITDPLNPDKENEVGSIRQINYSGVSFKPGFIFNKQLYRKDSVKYIDPYGERHDTIEKKLIPVFFKFGMATEFSPNVKATEAREVFVRNSRNLLTIDSTMTQTKSKMHLPTTCRIGTSFESPGRWAIAADLAYTNWTGFNKGTFKTDSLNTSSYSLFLGGEYLPQTKEKVEAKNKTFRALRVKTYRAGLSYSATQISIDGHRLYDYSCSFGATLPVGVRSKSAVALPKLNIAFVVGQRSTFSSGQLTETYYRLYLGMTISDKWFNKRRIQ